MSLAPVRLGNTVLEAETAAADRKSCRRFGPCGVGEKALYLNDLLIDRHFYVGFGSVRRVFKRVAMSQGGFSGKGAFGSIPYLVVQYDDGQEKQCTFKREEDVDELLAYLGQVHPEIPRLSVGGEQRLAKKAQQEASRYLKELTPQAQSVREELERARKFLSGYPELTAQLAAAAKAKRINEHTNPAYRWVALAIVLAGAAALVYGIISWRGGSDFGVYFALFGFAAVFFFSGAHVLPTAKNNRRAVERAWDKAQAAMANVLPEDFPLPARYAHPIVLDRMIRILQGGSARRAQSRPQGAHRRRAGRAGGARRGRSYQASVPCERLSISRKQRRTLYRLHRVLPFFAFETVSVQNTKLFVYFMLAIFFSLCIISLVL